MSWIILIILAGIFSILFWYIINKIINLDENKTVKKTSQASKGANTFISLSMGCS
jgi:phosphate/sulfate permease